MHHPLELFLVVSFIRLLSIQSLQVERGSASARLQITTTGTRYPFSIRLPSFSYDIRRSRSTRLAAVSRRDALLKSGAAVLGGSQATKTTTAPLVELPLQKVRLPQGGVGGDFLTIPIMIGNKGPYIFMVDTGLTLELVSPHLQKQVGLSPQSVPGVQSFGAGGSSESTNMAQLKDVRIGNYKLPPLNAIIADFPQLQLGNIQGMLGMECLQHFDVIVDVPNDRFALYPPGQAPKEGMVPIPAMVINETGLWGIRVRATDKFQPVLALIDCGSSFTCVNNAAATILGMDDQKGSDLSIYAVGVDGRPLQMPLIQSPFFTYAGSAQYTNGRLVGFDAPPIEWQPWEPVPVAVGDLPVFSSVIGNGREPYAGPAVLMGLDILSQRRWIMEASSSGRDRVLYMSPS